MKNKDHFSKYKFENVKERKTSGWIKTIQSKEFYGETKLHALNDEKHNKRHSMKGKWIMHKWR